jgi:sulfite reductase (ferredoxin)
LTEIRPLSDVEGFKAQSRHLRGPIGHELVNDAPNFSGESEQLLKFHGIYSQDDRDVRRERTLAKEPLDYSFMIRVVIPGGRLSPQQWLALDGVADTIADGSLRLTTRQAIQFHGVRKGGLRPLASELHQRLMTSFGACGDVVRNVVSCPLHDHSASPMLRQLPERLALAFRPNTKAWWEVFVDGDLAASAENDPERDLYGETYLPRKFKIGVASSTENCIDVYAQDLGIIPAIHPELGQGYHLVVGGGLGRSYANPDTFARLAEPLTFVLDDELETVIQAVVVTYRDLGNRSDRRRARMKYIVSDLGLEQFRSEVAARLDGGLRDPITMERLGEADDHLGWNELSDATWTLGVPVLSGRLRDGATASPKAALKSIAERFDVSFTLTALQDILITGIGASERDAIDAVLAEHHVVPVSELSSLVRSSLACPALPTCSQALTESERRLPEMIGLIEAELSDLGIQSRPLQLRMTGCPNGCARPAVAEVGIVGRTKTTYDLYVGGGPNGDRLATLHQEKVKFEDIPGVLNPLLKRWREESHDEERFGEFLARVGSA